MPFSTCLIASDLKKISNLEIDHCLRNKRINSSKFAEEEEEEKKKDEIQKQSNTVHSVIFSKTLFDFKKSISRPIELKFSGKTLDAILLATIYFWGVYF